MRRAKRLIWIGIDGASAGFFEKFIAEGKLPTFAALRERGVFSESLPIPPCDTPTNWSSLQTGAHTGTHEAVSFFTHRPGDPLNVVHPNVRSDAVKAELFWEAAERQGKRCIVFNWPCSWPSRLKDSIQINGTGPFTPSWRITFGRVYAYGDFGQRVMDPAVMKMLGGLGERIRVAPARGWAGLPASPRPPLEATLHLCGTEQFRWTEGGMQVLDQGSGRDGAAPGQHAYHLLILDTVGEGYDRVVITRSRDLATAVCSLTVGEWSGWLSERFRASQVLEQLVPIGKEEVEGVFKLKLTHLDREGHALALYRTDIWTADGWAHPTPIAAELRQAVGPFTEGLELPPATARLMDEWDTYQEQLEQARTWYVEAARHLTRRYPWDVLAVQWHTQDGINHVLARDICEEDPSYRPDRAQKAWRQFEACYVACDRLVGGLIDACADEDTLVCVVSDHGALPIFRECLLHPALVRAGLMAYQRDPADGRWKVDWSRTKVFPRRGYLWVNVRGRDPQGIVPPEEYEQVREQAIQTLSSIRDPENGVAPIALAIRKEDGEVYGQWGDKVGDVMFFMAPRYADSDVDYFSVPADPRSAQEVGPTSLGCAHHLYLPTAAYQIWRNRAVFFLMGPGVREGYHRARSITQVDVAPTLAHLIGIAPPANCEGKVVTDFLMTLLTLR